MKTLLLCVSLLVSYCVADQCSMVPADMESGVTQTTVAYEDFLYSTFNDTDTACGRMGCCPKIVVWPRSKGSVIQPFSGYRGNVAIIVDWGVDPSSCNPYRRRCTLNDSPFLWYVNWGDGTRSWGHQKTIGPFQVAHQYPQICKPYGVTVVYCSDPGHCPHRRCCDSIYKVIDVSYDPQQPHPDVKYEKF